MAGRMAELASDERLLRAELEGGELHPEDRESLEHELAIVRRDLARLRHRRNQARELRRERKRSGRELRERWEDEDAARALCRGGLNGAELFSGFRRISGR